jgi:hypothetical protein
MGVGGSAQVVEGSRGPPCTPVGVIGSGQGVVCEAKGWCLACVVGTPWWALAPCPYCSCTIRGVENANEKKRRWGAYFAISFPRDTPLPPRGWLGLNETESENCPAHGCLRARSQWGW